MHINLENNINNSKLKVATNVIKIVFSIETVYGIKY